MSVGSARQKTTQSTKVVDTTLTWASLAAAGTENTIDLTGAAAPSLPWEPILVVVRNPSTASYLNGQLQTQYLDGATTRYALLTTFAVSNTAVSAGGESFLLAAAGVGVAGRLSFKNATAAESGGFTVAVLVFVPVLR